MTMLPLHQMEDRDVGSVGDQLGHQQNGRNLSEYLKMALHYAQLDIEYTFAQMWYILVHPRKVYQLTSYRKQTKNHWSRDDPAFVVLTVLFLLVASVAYALAFHANFFKVLFWTVGVHYVLLGVVVASAYTYICNNYLRERGYSHHGSVGGHYVRQEVEWQYAWDVHCNGFIHVLWTVYVLQFLLLPILYDDLGVPRLLDDAVEQAATTSSAGSTSSSTAGSPGGTAGVSAGVVSSSESGTSSSSEDLSGSSRSASPDDGHAGEGRKLLEAMGKETAAAKAMQLEAAQRGHRRDDREREDGPPGERRRPPGTDTSRAQPSDYREAADAIVANLQELELEGKVFPAAKKEERPRSRRPSTEVDENLADAARSRRLEEGGTPAAHFDPSKIRSPSLSSCFLANLLFGCSLLGYFYVTSMGYAMLPFLEKTEVLLYPCIALTLLIVLCVFLRINLTSWFIWTVC